MKGIQYIIDDKGEKTAVVINLKQWGHLWEKLYSFLVKDSFLNEEWLYQSDVEERLNKALEWNANNPPEVSDLEALEKKLNSYE